VARLLDKLKDYAQRVYFNQKDNAANEDARLTAAKSAASLASDQASLDAALQFNKAEQHEATHAIRELLQTYYTAKAALGSKSQVPDCGFLVCGENAKCKVGRDGARCECLPCFMGDGYQCRASVCDDQASLPAQPVAGPTPEGYPIMARVLPANVKEVHVSLVSQGTDERVAVAFRDHGASDRGSLVIGRVKDLNLEWGNWLPFSSEGRAFGPVVAGLPNGRLVIAFRDAPQGGFGYLVGGQLQGSGSLQAALTVPKAFAPSLSENPVLVALATSRVACLYTGRTMDDSGHLRHIFGGAALLHVLENGQLSVLGRYRFADGQPVEHIAATALSPTSLVVAYRVVPDGTAALGEASAELSAVWMGMHNDKLAVDPHPIQLEAKRVDMKLRDVSLVSMNLFAYSYESVGEQTVKMVVVRVDPVTHRMSVTGAPQVLGRGKVDYVQAISLPNGAMSPTTFTYFQQPNQTSMAEVCRVSPAGRIADCKDVMWGEAVFQSVSGARLADGRLAMAMVGPQGKMFFQLLGPSETGAQGPVG